MSLHPCPDCGLEISSLAKRCPQCGRQGRGADGVRVIGVDISFWDLVGLFTLSALAAIPALIIASLTVGAILFALALVLAGIGVFA